MIHTTVGLYPNGDHKSNGVESENLAEHIRYQRFRPGRTFYVDGVEINEGNATQETKDKFLTTLESIVYTKDTQPYI